MNDRICLNSNVSNVGKLMSSDVILERLCMNRNVSRVGKLMSDVILER